MSIQYDLELRKHVHISNKNLVKLSFDVDIDKISGNFLCHDNHLTSLEGCPSQVDGHFYCYDNHLTSLEHCPSQVGGNFNCQRNRITSLEHCPSQVGGHFSCQCNELTSLEGCQLQLNGDFYCQYNQLTSLEHCPSYVNGDLVCRSNKLTSLQDIHKYINKIGKEFNCENNLIKSHILGLMWIEISGNIKTGLGNGTDVDAVLNKWKNQGRRGIMGAMKELSDLGYDELAQL